MAYPVFYPFKTRMYQATTTASAASVPGISCVVGARGKYLGGFFSANIAAGTTSTGTVDVLLNGTGIGGSTGVASTSTGVFASYVIPIPTTAIYLNAGDVLTASSTNIAVGGWSVTHIVQEF